MEGQPPDAAKPTEEPYGIPGKRLVLPVILVVVAVAVIAGLYTAQERYAAPVSASFARVDAGENATMLDAKEVLRADKFLEAHLERAREDGASNEGIRLRVESMRETLVAFTGQAGPTFLVAWKDTYVEVRFTGFDPASDEAGANALDGTGATTAATA